MSVKDPRQISRRQVVTWLGAGAAATLLSACARMFGGRPAPAPPDGATEPIPEHERTGSAPPREGPSLPESRYAEMDELHRRRVEMFPAETTGRGLEVLVPRIDDDGAKVFDLTCSEIQWEVEPGMFRTAWAYNGQVPGPTIRVTEGDLVRVHITNELAESTSIHWHGMSLRNDMDGVPYVTQPPIEPGQTYTYEFRANPSGTHMYHSHHNSAKQVAMGLLGPLLVDPLDPSKDPPNIDREYVLVLNDGPLGYTINGKSFPATDPIIAKKGERVLLRWMNEGAMAHPMHLHGNPMLVWARDGYPQPQPWYADTINVAPGERWDTVVDCEWPGKWALHCHVLPHAEGAQGMYGLTTVMIIEE